MKSYLLIVSLLIFFINNLFGEVKNGYEKDVANFRSSIQSLKNILLNDRHLSNRQKRKINTKIRMLVNYLAYYEITDTLLKQFRDISPEIYYEMDTLKDSNGRIIDVYVKFIPEGQAVVHSAGMASFRQSENDLNSSSSEYGVRSVSVKIWIMNNALWVLAHEFGHIKYMVPNLVSYIEFYKKRYPRGLSEQDLSHRKDDLSGKAACEFEQRFRGSYLKYMKLDLAPVKSPMALINPIKKNILLNLNESGSALPPGLSDRSLHAPHGMLTQTALDPE